MSTATIAAPAAAAPEKKSKLKLLVFALPLLVALAAVGTWYFVLREPGPTPPPEPGEIVKLDPISLNLADGHFLKLGLALQATADAKEAPDGAKALDLAIAQLSGRSVAELSSAEGRKHAKEELLKKIEKSYDDEVMAIYFTDFVMQ